MAQRLAAAAVGLWAASSEANRRALVDVRVDRAVEAAVEAEMVAAAAGVSASGGMRLQQELVRCACRVGPG